MARPKLMIDRRISQIRIVSSVWDKVKFLAELDRRTINSEIEFILAQYVEAYEAENGPIEIQSDDSED